MKENRGVVIRANLSEKALINLKPAKFLFHLSLSGTLRLSVSARDILLNGDKLKEPHTLLCALIRLCFSAQNLRVNSAERVALDDYQMHAHRIISLGSRLSNQRDVLAQRR
jgi:hypothetical protein